MSESIELEVDIDNNYASMWEKVKQKNPEASKEMENALSGQIENIIHQTYQRLKQQEEE